jgi:hypothetical protein
MAQAQEESRGLNNAQTKHLIFGVSNAHDDCLLHLPKHFGKRLCDPI